MSAPLQHREVMTLVLRNGPRRREPQWRIRRSRSLTVQHTEAGRLALPLELSADDLVPTDVLMVLTAEEAAALVRDLQSVLCGTAAEDTASDHAGQTVTNTSVADMHMASRGRSLESSNGFESTRPSATPGPRS